MQSKTPAISVADLPLCRLCKSTLHPAHMLIGVCAWCIAGERAGVTRKVRNPGYGFTNGQKADDFPIPE